jgi:hypothetical protein
LGVPWQTDEASCLSGYDTTTYLPLPSFWAARVPNQVMSEDSYERMNVTEINIAQRLKHFDYRQDWLREFGTQYLSKINKMIHEWHDLGIIAETKPRNEQNEFLPDRVWKETGLQYTGIDPTMQQVRYAENVTEKPDMLVLGKDTSEGKNIAKKRPFFGRNER